MFWSAIKSNIKTCRHIWKIKLGQEDHFTTGYFLGDNHFKKYCKMMSIESSKQPAIDADLEAIQQINFTGNLENNSSIFFLYWRCKRNWFRGFTRNCETIAILFCFNIKWLNITQKWLNTLNVKFSNF